MKKVEAAARAARLADQGADVEAEGHAGTSCRGGGGGARPLVALHPAVAQMDLPAGEGGHRRIVGDQHQGGPLAGAQLGQQLQDAAAGGAVEVAGGLVGEQDRRPGGEGAGEGDPLLLAARELARVVVAAVGEADGGQQLVGARRTGWRGRAARPAAARSRAR